LNHQDLLIKIEEEGIISTKLLFKLLNDVSIEIMHNINKKELKENSLLIDYMSEISLLKQIIVLSHENLSEGWAKIKPKLVILYNHSLHKEDYWLKINNVLEICNLYDGSLSIEDELCDMNIIKPEKRRTEDESFYLDELDDVDFYSGQPVNGINPMSLNDSEFNIIFIDTNIFKNWRSKEIFPRFPGKIFLITRIVINEIFRLLVSEEDPYLYLTLLDFCSNNEIKIDGSLTDNRIGDEEILKSYKDRSVLWSSDYDLNLKWNQNLLPARKFWNLTEITVNKPRISTHMFGKIRAEKKYNFY